MADKLVPSPDDTGAVRRFVDMGDSTFAEQVVIGSAGAAGAAGLPPGATPVASTFNVANAIGVATLPGAVGKRTYITGLQISGLGATAATAAAATLAGILGGSSSYYISVPAGAAVPIDPLLINFNPPLPASADNTAITLTLNAFGAGSPAAMGAIQGYQK